MSYAFLKSGACPNCLTEFDADCPEPCDETCVECKRTAGPCECHCNDLAIIAHAIGTEDNFHYCFCESTIDHKSIDPTYVVVGVEFELTGSPDAVASLLEISGKTCPDSPGLTWYFYKSQVTPDSETNLICPSSITNWGELPIDADKHNYIVSDDFPGAAIAGFLVSVFYPNPLGEEYPDTYDCDPQRFPAAFLIQVKDNCGNQILLCPIKFEAVDTVGCPVCGQFEIVSAVGSGCPGGLGQVDIHLGLFGCGIGKGPGTAYLEYGTYTAELTWDESAAILSFTDIPCLDSDTAPAIVHLSFLSIPDKCPDCVVAITLCLSIPLDGNPYLIC